MIFKEVVKDALIGTGMQIVITDEDGKEIERKTVVVPGDIQGDGKITASDARQTLRASVELETLASYELEAADLKQDGKPKAEDARAILRISVELEKATDYFEKIG